MSKTIYDVAKLAGVSVATVSRALNGTGYVSPETLAKITQACDGYSRAPKQKKVHVKSIGLVISHDPEYFFVNDTYLKAMIGISAVAREKSFNLILEINNQNQRCLELFREGQIDGVILMGIRQSSALIPELVKAKYPFVLIGDYAHEEAFSKIDIDDYAMAREAVNHLIELGHKRIAYIGGSPDYSSCRKRAEGYRSALRDAGLESPEEYCVTCDSITDEKAFNLAKKLLYQTNRATAILTFNDTVAFATYQAAKEVGIRIPEGLSVISFDDSDEAKYVSPSLTTVRQPSFEKGYQAALHLVKRIEHPELPPESATLESILIFRNSCMPPPAQR